jgi:hypothetical protein
MSAWKQSRLPRALVLTALVAGLLAAAPGSASAAACSNSSIHIDGYTLIGPTGVRQPAAMSGQVREGDSVAIDFTIAPTVTGTCDVALVSYTAPNATFDMANYVQQQIYQYSSGSVTPGAWSATIRVPTCYFQTDFVRGPLITQFGPTAANTYSGWPGGGRLLDTDHGGTETCGPEDAPLPPAPPPSQSPV